jgi:hypothetical protein
MTDFQFSRIDPKSLHGARCIENAAMLCHEANRAFVLSCNRDDRTQLPWASSSDHVRASCIAGVHGVLAKRNTKPGESHESWMKYKLEQGWKIGPIKSEERKEHPNLVPFEKLSVLEQAKDYLFIATALASLSTYGPRFAYQVPHWEAGEIGSIWRCTERRYDVGMFVIEGRAYGVAMAASTELAMALGYPARDTHRNGLRRRVQSDHVRVCMINETVENAYESYRAQCYPHIMPELNLVHWQDPHVAGTVHRAHWFVTHAIVRTVMLIEGAHIIGES